MCLLSYEKNCLCFILFFLSFTQISYSSLPSSFSCFQTGTCSCRGNNGEEMDLSSLANLDQPLLAATTSSLYIYHPCTDVPLPTITSNECQKSYGLCHFVSKEPSNEPLDYKKVISNLTVGVFHKLAVNKQAVIIIDHLNQLQIVYKHTNNSDIITSYLTLNCDENENSYKLTIGKITENTYEFTLTSKYACVKMSGGTPHYLSGGAIFFIIVLVFFALYFIGGIVVLKFIRGATGIEMIPNHEFWCKLPQLLKDGVMYLVSCGKTTPDSYEKI